MHLQENNYRIRQENVYIKDIALVKAQRNYQKNEITLVKSTHLAKTKLVATLSCAVTLLLSLSLQTF